jgi:polyphosphate kinase
VKFCAIFSSNLDEFFQVRVAGPPRTGRSRHHRSGSADGLTPQQALARIRERVLELSAVQSRLWKRDLRPALAAEGITVGGIEDLSDKELGQLEKRFQREVYPVLTPLGCRSRPGRSRTSRASRSRSRSSPKTPTRARSASPA